MAANAPPSGGAFVFMRVSLPLMTQDPEELIKALGDRFQRVRLGGGVVVKTAYVVGALVVMWSAVIWRVSSSPLEDGALFSAAAIATGVAVWWINATHRFAEKNPLQAMLSGAEFVEYQRAFTAQTKDLSAQINPVLVPDPKLPQRPSSDPSKEDR